jgi:hypothetical protein
MVDRTNALLGISGNEEFSLSGRNDVAATDEFSRFFLLIRLETDSLLMVFADLFGVPDVAALLSNFCSAAGEDRTTAGGSPPGVTWPDAFAAFASPDCDALSTLLSEVTSGVFSIPAVEAVETNFSSRGVDAGIATDGDFSFIAGEEGFSTTPSPIFTSSVIRSEVLEAAGGSVSTPFMTSHVPRMEIAATAMYDIPLNLV